jgi:hypothetical protein
METLLMRVLSLIFLLVLAASAQSNRAFTIAFDIEDLPQSETQVFRVHAAPNLLLAASNWPPLTNLFLPSLTNGGFITYTSASKVNASLPATYFVVSSSNEWGIFFSDTFATLPPAKAAKIRLR